MPLTYSQWIWGFELKDATSGAQNNKLEFNDGSPRTLLLTPGVYTVDEFEAHVDAMMKTINASYTCAFDYVTLKFTIAGPAAFSLTFGTGTSPAGLLGFPASNTASTTPHVSPSAAGAGNSTAGAWTALEPVVMTSPITAQGSAQGYKSLLGQRSMRTMQHVSDGGTVESIFISTLTSVQVAFRALSTSGSPSERDKMELFLNWAVTGKRFTWQPDKTSTNLLKLVLANPGEINNQFEWLTRSETGYGTLTFYEQLSP